jgi:hypothetical protein
VRSGRKIVGTDGEVPLQEVAFADPDVKGGLGFRPAGPHTPGQISITVEYKGELTHQRLSRIARGLLRDAKITLDENEMKHTESMLGGDDVEPAERLPRNSSRPPVLTLFWADLIEGDGFFKHDPVLAVRFEYDTRTVGYMKQLKQHGLRMIWEPKPYQVWHLDRTEDAQKLVAQLTKDKYVLKWVERANFPGRP